MLDGQFDLRRIFRWGCDGIAATRTVAIGRRQTDVDMLPGPEVEGLRGGQEEALDARRLHDDVSDGCRLPTHRRSRAYARLSHPYTAVRAMDRHRCGSRGAPRSRLHLAL